MFMSLLLIVISCILYGLLKPPVHDNFIIVDKIAFPRDSSRNSEGVAVCLISKHFIP
jgi:hypothetical protein